MAASVLGSIDVLVGDDPRALDDDDLKLRLGALVVADGAVDAKSWLAHHTAVARSTAGAWVWLVKRWRFMPAFAAALAAGSVTVDHVRVMAAALNPRTLELFVRDEALLVGHAQALAADDFAHVVARWRFLADPDGPDQGRDKPSELHVSSMLDGRHRLDGELDLEDSVEYLAELEAATRRSGSATMARTPPTGNATAPRRSGTRRRRWRWPGGRRWPAMLTSTTAPRSRFGPRPARPRSSWSPTPPPSPVTRAGRAELDDGTPVPADLLARWACDSAIGRVVMMAGTVPVDVGRLTYTASDGQRRALTVRDRGCIVPGCRRKARWCHAHHVIPWQHGGPTNLSNLVLVCARHHTHVHKGIIRIIPGDRAGTFIITRADGIPLRQRPPPSQTAA